MKCPLAMRFKICHNVGIQKKTWAFFHCHPFSDKNKVARNDKKNYVGPVFIFQNYGKF